MLSPSSRDNHVFVLFACCVAVRGASRSTICDLQRRRYQLIPNTLHDILKRHKGESVAAIKAAYEPQYHPRIDEYLAFLVANEFGFWCDEPDRFPDLNTEWETPQRITNAIVDFDEKSPHDLERIVAQLDDLGCGALQLRFFYTPSPHRLRELLHSTDTSRLRSVELILRFGPDYGVEELEALGRDFPRVTNIFLHSAPSTSTYMVVGDRVAVVQRTEAVTSAAHCGEVHPGYFIADLSLYLEGLHYNTCLNRKIAVDARGDIRNCPALPSSYGNIRDTSLHSALLSSTFTTLWTINKDQIDTCADCEFRYLCTDCRAFITRPDDIYSKPAKCAYNPYTMDWGDAGAGGPLIGDTISANDKPGLTAVRGDTSSASNRRE